MNTDLAEFVRFARREDDAPQLVHQRPPDLSPHDVRHDLEPGLLPVLGAVPTLAMS